MSTLQSIGRARRTAGALFVVVSIAAVGCGRDDEPASYQPKEVRADLVTAARTTVPRTVLATGELEARNAVEVSTRLMGQVREVLVREGDTVTAGQCLVRIDDTDIVARKQQADAAIAEARAVLENAETNLARFERLYAESSVSKAQLDEVRTGRDRALATVQRAEAGLAEVDVQLGYLRIKAPAGGTVTRRLVDPGDMASPGMPLVMLEQTGVMKVRAGIGEKDVDLVNVGAEVRVKVTSLDQAVYTVPVARIIPSANPQSRTFDLEAYIPNEDGRLRTGMFARVEVAVGSRDAVLVPAEALHARGQLTGVWIVDDTSTAHLRWIRSGRAIGDEVEVLSGLQGGEVLVLRADLPLVEGDKVVK
ncbi:MAG TPA: efflux RND transporter periplasmic adaptor subunit [Candidatus Krumholzibacteria bacterium]|nr:efflux RND transporter periplasmic adaptor subunit [Candidatus Krumholzibacteria bacterium]HPD70607.1 efflux RND transporter periplasmic adaptor subunit [Candidatus Krumholzibacteria bacterium]HRY39693.1 efflux RND transporter periplasmic adaptor subunit [Candidatus Krumholzibacteria bacterium]